jgi:integrase
VPFTRCRNRAWDPKSSVYVAPKSRAGVRRVPIVPELRELLLDHKMAGDGVGLVWRSSAGEPFNTSALRSRALKAWTAAGLQPVTLHEPGHTFASLTIAAGVNAKGLAAYMGHANISVTFDHFGHLIPADDDEAAALSQDYLDRSNTRARLRAVSG